MHEGKILKYLSRNAALCTLACFRGGVPSTLRGGGGGKGGSGGAEKNFMSLSKYVFKSQNINTVCYNMK